MPKLKDHLIPRLKAVASSQCSHPSEETGSVPNGNRANQHDSVYFKADRIYLHKLARFQYTTYDVRRGQDVINPSTPHRDIMLLANTDDNCDHPFIYARVLGIYHANVIFTGDNLQNYQARRLEFLWVRWYKYEGPNVQWRDSKLDKVSFPPITSEGAFGFVDPNDVLRGCHIIPVFSGGKKYQDGVGISHCARDAHDWSRYYVNRWVKLGGSSHHLSH